MLKIPKALITLHSTVIQKKKKKRLKLILQHPLLVISIVQTILFTSPGMGIIDRQI